jgi:ribosomal protein S18 acetylase RimI-like enzyme
MSWMMKDELDIQVAEEPIETLAQQREVSIAFQYTKLYDVIESPDGFVLTEQELATPRIKDYDLVDDDDPTNWSERFDVSKWGFIVGRSGGKRIAGAVIAYGHEGIEVLEDRDDLAVLWDLRIDPNFRNKGIGPKLFQAVEAWAVSRGCTELKIETQNTNIPACKFYARQGCSLRAANRDVYICLPEEIQMFWRKSLV